MTRRRVHGEDPEELQGDLVGASLGGFGSEDPKSRPEVAPLVGVVFVFVFLRFCGGPFVPLLLELRLRSLFCGGCWCFFFRVFWGVPLFPCWLVFLSLFLGVPFFVFQQGSLKKKDGPCFASI